jgi:hypothetical protein
VASIKTDLMKRRPIGELYIALEDVDFTWRQEEVAMIAPRMALGYTDEYIAQAFERDLLEVELLRRSLQRDWENRKWRGEDGPS